jgi:hypothetical protein
MKPEITPLILVGWFVDQILACQGSLLLNNIMVMKRARAEAVVNYLNILSKRLPAGTEERNKSSVNMYIAFSGL